MKVKLIVEIETGSKEVRNAITAAIVITQDMIAPEKFIIQYGKTTLVGQSAISKLMELIHEKS